MKLGVILIIIAGFALVAYLIHYIGFDAVLSAVTAVGWSGFAIFCGLGLINFALLGIAWWVLVPGMKLGDIPTFAWGRMMRDSSAELLPFSQVGGFVFGARALVIRGVPTSAATASTIVDVTTELLAQLAFIAIGLVMLTLRAPASPFKTSLTTAMLIGLGLALVATVGFVITQQRGLGFLEKAIERFLPKALEHTAAVNQLLAKIHSSRVRMGISSAVHLASWVTGALGTWVVMRLVGAHIEFGAALAIEALLCAVRSAAFAIPSAVGVQELTYAFVVPLFGLPPSIGLAVSLIKRGRDIVVGGPILLVWQFMEGHRQIAARKPAVASASEKK
ncbi:MAG: lysylphosphatidylglycerol synthase domain-containing protein [Alphaproteobacteria bacterium]